LEIHAPDLQTLLEGMKEKKDVSGSDLCQDDNNYDGEWPNNVTGSSTSTFRKRPWDKEESSMMLIFVMRIAPGRCKGLATFVVDLELTDRNGGCSYI
jgi:hypothetical protein